jgi:L-lactate utilization protein LutB
LAGSTSNSVNAASIDTDYFGNASKSKEAIRWDVARRRAFNLRSKAMEHLDRHLIEFETQFTRQQGKMLWAPQSDFARNELRLMLRGKPVYTYSHPMLKELGMEEEKGWTLLQEGSTIALPNDAVAIVFPAFFVSENGSLILTHKHPTLDALLAGCQKIIYVMGIEQVIPSFQETENLLTLLAIGSEGELDYPAVHVCSGNKQIKEEQGPSESWALMLDNGRSNLLAEIPQRKALYCIGCNACNSYSNLQAVNKNSPSVIELIRAPFKEGPHRFADTFMLPLSGKATEACPVGIDLKALVLENRRLAVERRLDGRSDGLAWKAWKTAMLSRKWLNKGVSMKNFTLRSFFNKYWGEGREFPKIVDQSFNEWWIEVRGKNED